MMRLACYDPETGRELGDYSEISRQLDEEVKARQEAERARQEAELRAEAETRARAEAEATILALREELKRTRGTS